MRKLPLLLLYVCIVGVFVFSNSMNSNQKRVKVSPEKSSFVIKSIDSLIITAKKEASDDKALKAVGYKVTLFTKKNLSSRELTNLEFSVQGDSLINNAYVIASTPLMLDKTLKKGYLYTLQLETMYRENYTQKQLEDLKNDRNFHLNVIMNGKKYFVQ